MYKKIKDMMISAFSGGNNANTVLFQHQLNDSISPVMAEMEMPKKASMPFVVRGYKGPVPTTDSNYRAANMHAAVASSIDQMQSMIRKSKRPINKWAATRTLEVVPDAGKMLNAYYNRKGLYFFHEQDPVAKKMIYTGDSTDIVTHELGHAILDAMRPDFWSVQALEIWAFHEAFADITAMLHLMKFDEAINKALEETNGTMKASNNISRLAEEMGLTIKHYTTGQKYDGPMVGLRDAVNNFNYTDPANLPKNGPDEKLVAECHSFGRVFAGAWYDLFVEIYNKESAKKNPIDAVKRARDIAGGYLMKAIPQTPRVAKYHDAIARSMLAIDKARGGEYQEIMGKVWKDRNLLYGEIKMLSNKKWDDVSKKLNGKDKILKSPNIITAKVTNMRMLKLADVLSEDKISALSTPAGDLMNVSLEVPSDSYYEFDRNGNMIHEIIPDESEIIAAAQACVAYIHQNNDVDNTKNTRWEIKSGKLQRTYID